MTMSGLLQCALFLPSSHGNDLSCPFHFGFGNPSFLILWFSAEVTFSDVSLSYLPASLPPCPQNFLCWGSSMCNSPEIGKSSVNQRNWERTGQAGMRQRRKDCTGPQESPKGLASGMPDAVGSQREDFSKFTSLSSGPFFMTLPHQLHNQVMSLSSGFCINHVFGFCIDYLTSLIPNLSMSMLHHRTRLTTWVVHIFTES